MQTLIIAGPDLKAELEPTLDAPDDVTWISEFDPALQHLQIEDTDAVVFDLRARPGYHQDLRILIANVSVTTRLLALVEHLPEDTFFSECGVVYFTPPVKLEDIGWFIKGGSTGSD